MSSAIRLCGGPSVRTKTGQRWRQHNRRNVLIETCQINVTCMPHTHGGASSSRSRLKWWTQGKGKEWLVEYVVGGVQLKTDAEMAWQGLFPFCCKTVIWSDRVVFPSLHKGYAIASSPHDTMNETQLLKPETLIRSVLSIRTILRSIHNTFKSHVWASQSWIAIFPPLVCDL